MYEGLQQPAAEVEKRTVLKLLPEFGLLLIPTATAVGHDREAALLR